VEQRRRGKRRGQELTVPRPTRSASSPLPSFTPNGEEEKGGRERRRTIFPEILAQTRTSPSSPHILFFFVIRSGRRGKERRRRLEGISDPAHTLLDARVNASCLPPFHQGPGEGRKEEKEKFSFTSDEQKPTARIALSAGRRAIGKKLRGIPHQRDAGRRAALRSSAAKQKEKEKASRTARLYNLPRTSRGKKEDSYYLS